jgi:putative DNA primase/helicase
MSVKFSQIREVCDSVVTSAECSLKEELLTKWFVSAYAAVARKDGDNFRNRGVLVLQGKQGIGKTTFLRNLCGGAWGGSDKWFGEGTMLNLENKDSKMEAISSWITELSELERTTKKDMPSLKAFLTNSTDKLRKPYAAEETSFARRTVFAGTVNPDDFLTDSTGNSRFWVIPVKEFKDISHIDMQQFWAEVKELYESGKQWWLTSGEELMLEEKNKDYEPENPVGDYLEKDLDWDAHDSRWEYKTLSKALQECGMREPKTNDCRMAVKFIRQQLGDDVKPQTIHGIRKYLLPPKKNNFNDGFTPIDYIGGG